MNEDAKRVEPPTSNNHDDEPDTSDIPELSDDLWSRAEVGKFYRPPAQPTPN